MADVAAFSGGSGIAFLVAAEVTYAVVAAACSSPQTTELNAGARSKTLMKWVYLGLGQAVLLLLISTALEPGHKWAILGGGSIAGALMWLSYTHARAAGLKSCEPGTESY